MRAAWLRCVTWTRGLQTMEPVAEQDRAQAQPVLTTQCPPPSSCAMSSLLLPPGSATEAAEASGARTSLCPGLWGQKTTPPPQGLPIFWAGPADAGHLQLPNKSLHLHMVCIRLCKVPSLLRGTNPSCLFPSCSPQRGQISVLYPAPEDTPEALGEALLLPSLLPFFHS